MFLVFVQQVMNDVEGNFDPFFISVFDDFFNANLGVSDVLEVHRIVFNIDFLDELFLNLEKPLV